MRLHWRSLLIALGILLVEILIATRFAHLVFIRSNLGDFLVVIFIFYLVKAFWSVPARPLAIAVFVFACGVEIVQLLRPAELLGLRPGSFFFILLGNRFSWLDILMYLGGCAAAYYLSTRKLFRLSRRWKEPKRDQ